MTFDTSHCSAVVDQPGLLSLWVLLCIVHAGGTTSSTNICSFLELLLEVRVHTCELLHQFSLTMIATRDEAGVTLEVQ